MRLIAFLLAVAVGYLTCEVMTLRAQKSQLHEGIKASIPAAKRCADERSA